MNKTALLVMDYQNDIIPLVGDRADVLLKNAKALIDQARSKKVPVIYVQVAFRPGYPEVSPNNKSFSGLKDAQRMILGKTGTEIHPAVAPLESEVVVIKHRVGAFEATDLQTVLRSHGVNHIMLAGISTSGVVLSTLRYAADLDYRITVVSDACADNDEEVHRVLMEKVFPRQAAVIKTADAITQLN